MIHTVETQQLQPSPAPLDVAEESGLSFGILLVCFPDERQEIFELTRATVHVGRAPDNDVLLDDELIADHHAQILCDNSGCQVLDLGSHIGSQILERNDAEQRSLTGLRLPPKMPYPLIKGTTVLMGEILLIYYPSTQEIPKAVVASESLLRRVLRVATFLLLCFVIFGGSVVWVRSWLNGSASLANSAAPLRQPSIPTLVPASPTPAATPTLVSNIYVVDTTFELNLHIRVAPGLDQQILGKVSYGTVVRVWSEPVRVGPYHWVRVDAPNLSGWCIFDGLRPQ